MLCCAEIAKAFALSDRKATNSGILGLFVFGLAESRPGIIRGRRTRSHLRDTRKTKMSTCF